MVRRLLPEITPTPDVLYRSLKFCLHMKTSGGLAVFNTLTKEYILLDETEISALNERHPQSETALYLVNNRFLVPEEHNDCQLADEIYSFMSDIHFHQYKDGINSYTILPTSDCNARCFYCYEMGIDRMHMPEETAVSVAEYIKKTASEGEIKLHWFGGEPLYNWHAIDVICNRLKESGIKYRSEIATNAYLFTEELAEKAENSWHLRIAQITLDGTEQIYNKTKAYINIPDNESPYKTVISNILLLLRHNIRVQIRLNLTEENFDDLINLIDCLSETLPKQNGTNWHIYSHLLFEIERSNDEILRKRMFERQEYLTDYIKRKENINKKEYLNYRIDTFGCEATTGHAIVIAPDGELFLCEHVTETESCGTIEHDAEKFANIRYMREIMEKKDFCESCPIYPCCHKMKHCPVSAFNCSEELKNGKIRQFYECMSNELEFFTNR